MTVSRNTDSYHLKLVSAVFTNYIQNINQSIIYKMVTHSRPAYDKVPRLLPAKCRLLRLWLAMTIIVIARSGATRQSIKSLLYLPQLQRFLESNDNSLHSHPSTQNQLCIRLLLLHREYILIARQVLLAVPAAT